MLPNYLIIGAQKAGTTFLHEMLCTHPEVAPPKVKEVHYFDLNSHRSKFWYRRRFGIGPLHEFFRAGISGHLPRRGEATPYYLFHPLAAARIARCLPKVKLIAVLRNPVGRAYSHYQHNVRRGRENLSFADAVAAEPERLAGEEERILRDPAYRSFSHQHFSYVARGEYARQLEVYLGYFRRENLLVIKSEDLFQTPHHWFERTCGFLGINPESTTTDVWEPRNTGGEYTAIDHDVRTMLETHFRPHNRRLEALLERDLNW